MQLRVQVSLIALSVVATLAWSSVASAEFNIVQTDGWTLYTEGRLNAFISHTEGDGYPHPTAYGITAGSGLDTNEQVDTNNHLVSTRIRSGFLGNILAFGLKRNITETTTFKGYFSIWSTIETNRTRFLPINPDVREGYLKLEGPWGSFLAGRALGLYSRGSVEIDFNYAHGYGLGFPCDVATAGPACGQIGFGVLFPFFASGLVYATPKIGGFTLTGGVYDPVVLAGKLERTPLPRLEGELAYDVQFGATGKAHAFFTGLWQRLQRIGPADANGVTALETHDASGIAGGARAEVSVLRLGVAAFQGKGIGFAYALQNSPAIYNVGTANFRTFDGLYVQGALVLGKVDLQAGWGQARDHLLPEDGVTPSNPNPDTIPQTQTGISAGVVYHASSLVALDVDYFRANFKWSRGETQDLNFINAGITVVW